MRNPFSLFYNLIKFSTAGTKLISFSFATPDKDGNACIKTKNIFGKKAFVAHNSYSISKSVVALGMGFLFDKGKLRPSDKVYDFLAEYFPQGYDKAWESVTLDDLFRHKTGAKVGVDFDLTDASKWQDSEYLHTVLGYKIDGEIGKTWCYSDANYYILARVFEKVCGENVFSFLHRELFMPMNFYYDMWACDGNRHILGGTGLYLRTEDMAKLGLLWLQGGIWNNKRYLSKDWIDKAIPEKGYGYGVHRMNADAYYMTGMYGQGIYVNVKKSIVCAWHARFNNGVAWLCDLIAKLFI